MFENQELERLADCGHDDADTIRAVITRVLELAESAVRPAFKFDNSTEWHALNEAADRIRDLMKVKP